MLSTKLLVITCFNVVVNIEIALGDSIFINTYVDPQEDLQSICIAENPVQKSILERILKIYVFNNSMNDQCRLASEEYYNGLVQFKGWALKMLDASSKLQSGLLTGNFIEFGSYTQCINIKYDPNRNKTINGNSNIIMGKHCMITARPTEAVIKKMLQIWGMKDGVYKHVRMVFLNSTLEWSVCIPHVCNERDVFEHFNQLFNYLFEGLNIDVLNNVYCSTLEEASPSLSTGEIVVIAILIILCLVIAVSTGVDVYKGNAPNTKQGYETIFSLATNSERLTTRNQDHEKLSCLDGIRVLSIIFIIIGHRYLMSIFFVSANGFTFLNWLLALSSQVIIGGTVTVDSFLLLSSILLSYHLLIQLQKGVKFNLLLYYLHRLMRLSPSYAMVITLLCTFGHRFGSGPKWAQTWPAVVEPCRKYWWSALLHIQSYVNPKELCVIQSWYLSIDTFYYFLAPALLIPLARKKWLGVGASIVVCLIAMVVNFGVAWRQQFVVTSLMDKNLPTSAFFTEHYIQPHVRASPYIIGLLFGYVLFANRNNSVKIPTCVLAIGWSVSLSVLTILILCTHIFLDPHYEYGRWGSSVFMSVHRSVWALALCWIIWCCVHGYGGPVNSLLASRVFGVLGRITYSAFLIHMPFQFFDNAANKLPNYFSNFELLRKGCGDVVISFLLGYILTIMVEYPFYGLSLTLLKGDDKVKQQRMIMPAKSLIKVKTLWSLNDGHDPIDSRRNGAERKIGVGVGVEER